MCRNGGHLKLCIAKKYSFLYYNKHITFLFFFRLFFSSNKKTTIWITSFSVKMRRVWSSSFWLLVTWLLLYIVNWGLQLTSKVRSLEAIDVAASFLMRVKLSVPRSPTLNKYAFRIKPGNDETVLATLQFWWQFFKLQLGNTDWSS